MGGNWSNLEVTPEAEVIVLHEDKKVSKIYPTKAYRPKILEVMHKSGRKLNSVLWRTRLHYTWPGIRRTLMTMLVLAANALCCN